MSDVVANTESKDVNVNQVIEGQQPEIKIPENIKNYFEGVLNDVVKKHDTESQKWKSEVAGLNRKNTELASKVTEHERQKLTDKEQVELMKKELREKELSFTKKELLVDFPYVENDDRNELINYINGQDETEIKQNIEFMKIIIDKAVKAGIEKGIQERLSQTHKPLNQSVNQPSQYSNFENMQADELRAKGIEISKLPASKEKTQLLNQLMTEQSRRFKGG